MKRVSGRNKPEWPADQVERRHVASLIPYANNARTHSDEQIAQIAASIREWGWTVPVLVDEQGGLIAGHGRVLAAKSLGIEDIPVMVAKGWSEAQKRAYVLADNKLALNADWNEGLLRIELGELQGLGFDLALTGFGELELGALFKTEGMTDPDEAPEAPADPVTVFGDVWLLGSHRLVCGDSTKAESVDLTPASAKSHLMVTDPPYGVNYDATWRESYHGGKIKNRGAVLNDDRDGWSEAWSLFTGDVAYVWHGERQLVGMGAQLRECGFDLRNLIVWVKPSLTLGRGHYHSRHETCWYAVRLGGTGHWQGDRKQSTAWEIPGMNPAGGGNEQKAGHSTQKPVECMKRPIENNSSPGQAVYEPFSGSGTTIIAGEMTGRHVHAIELSPAYVDVAVTRWQNFTGREATLEATGRTFSETSAERARDKAA